MRWHRLAEYAAFTGALTGAVGCLGIMEHLMPISIAVILLISGALLLVFSVSAAVTLGRLSCPKCKHRFKRREWERAEGQTIKLYCTNCRILWETSWIESSGPTI